MKLLFFGNCQVEKVMEALTLFNPFLDMQYAGSSTRVTKYDPERTERLFATSDYILAQPIMNRNNPDNFFDLKARFGDRIGFMPYIYLDGIFSLVAAPNSKRFGGVINRDVCVDEIREHGMPKALKRFRTGATDFKHTERYANNLSEMTKRETHCDFKALDTILEHEGRAMLTHNHPHADILISLAAQVAEHLDLAFDAGKCRRPALAAQLTLPLFTSVISPYGIEDLKLKCDPDLNWFINGRTLYRQVEKWMIETGAVETGGFETGEIERLPQV